MTKDEAKIIRTEMTNDNLDLKEFKGVAKQYTLLLPVHLDQYSHLKLEITVFIFPSLA